MLKGITGFSFGLAQAPVFSPVAGRVFRPLDGFWLARPGLARVLAGFSNSTVCPGVLPDELDPDRGAPDGQDHPVRREDRSGEVGIPEKDSPDLGDYGDGNRFGFDVGGAKFAGGTTRLSDLAGPPLWWLAIYLQGNTTQKQPDRQSGPGNARATPDGEGFDDMGNPASPGRNDDNDGLSWGGGSDNSGIGWGSDDGGGRGSEF